MLIIDPTGKWPNMEVRKMSFLDKYLDNNQLSALPDQVLNRLQQLEQELKEKSTENGGDFGECVKTFGPQLADLSRRLAERIKTISVKSWREAVDLIKFSANIGFEIHQVVENVKDCVLPDELPAEEAKQRQLEFSKDLAYFVWMTVDPLANKLNWVPFKKTIEEKLVRWVAGMAIELAAHLFETKVMTSSGVKLSSYPDNYIKAL